MVPTHSSQHRAWMGHLMQAQEPLSGVLNTLHNLAFYLETMRRVRAEIAGVVGT